jgi:hypothetical protein
MKKKIGISDILLIVGLIGTGAGLYLEFGIGVSLSIVGTILTTLGFLIAPRSGKNGSN